MLTNERIGGYNTDSPKRIANLFFALVLFFGMLLIFIEPPLVVPDENTHFLNICRIYHGSLFANIENNVEGSRITAEEYDFIVSYQGIYNGEDNPTRFDYATMRELSKRSVSQDMVLMKSDLSEINPAAYMVPVVGVILGRVFLGSLNAYAILIISKITNLIFYGAIVRLAILRTGAFRNTMFLLALMPMSIFQAASASYDVMLIAGSLLLFAEVTRILLNDEITQIGKDNIVLVCVACVFLISVKIAYAPLILILLSIPVKKFGGWKKWGFCAGMIVALGAVFWLIPTIVTYVRSIIEPNPILAEQKAYVLAHPSAFPKAIFHSFKHFGGYWLETYFGILGWLDTYFPTAFFRLFIMLSSLVALVEACDIVKVSWKVRVLAAIGIFVFIVGTFYTVYLQWNPILVGIIGGNLIYGIQGRYFIPIALLFVLIFSNPLLKKIKYRDAIYNIVARIVPCISLCYLTFTVALLVIRYWI